MLTVTAGTAAARECTWTPATLPLPAGQDWGHVSAAADGGWFAGSGSSDAIRWHDGVAEDLGNTFGRQTEPTDINSAGTAVGLTYENSFGRDARPLPRRRVHRSAAPGGPPVGTSPRRQRRR
ncbi:hypothetical protein ACWEOE_33380 [Amycolatopsis sp. NPDC004368]